MAFCSRQFSHARLTRPLLVQVLVAAVDATGIAIGMVALSLGSYAVPIWLLVFLFSFIPLVGAIASGAIAVLLVLVLIARMAWDTFGR